jgi:hypothetical protein
MPNRGNPEFAQILGGQPQQHLGIDIVVAESRHITFKAQALQPRRYVHAVILGSEERQPLIDDHRPLPLKLPAVPLS